MKIVETTAKDAMTIKHFFATPMDEQGSVSMLCVVSGSLVGFGVVACDILVITGNNPPCVAFVGSKMVSFVEGISAEVVDMLKNEVLIGDSDVEKLMAFSVVLVWCASADPFVAEVGRSVVAEDWLNSLLWFHFTVVPDKVVSFTAAVDVRPLLFSGSTVEKTVVAADVVFVGFCVIGEKLVVMAGCFKVVFAGVCGSVFGNMVVRFLAVTGATFGDLFCCADVKTGAMVVVSAGATVVFSSPAVVVMKEVPLCVTLSDPETFSLAVLFFSVEFRGKVSLL